MAFQILQKTIFEFRIKKMNSIFYAFDNVVVLGEREERMVVLF